MGVRAPAQPHRLSVRRRRIARITALAAVISAGWTVPAWLTAAAPAAHAATTARAAAFSYCSSRYAVFNDKRAFLGFSDPYVENDQGSFRNCSFGLMAAAHVGLFRGGLSWAQTEYPAGHYSFAGFDALVAALARHHIRWLPVLLDPPKFRSTAPGSGPFVGMYPPRHANQFAQWVAVCVKRYGPHGTFWKRNPHLPYYPVTMWQVWNEPNLSTYWAPRPDPRAYVRLLAATYRAIHRVDGHAFVVSAGTPFYGPTDETAFLRTILRAGAGRYFDALALHPYSGTVRDAFSRLTVARRVLAQYHLPRKPLWITEWGWAGGPPDAYLVSQRGQNANVTAFLRLIAAKRRGLRLQHVFYYTWRDTVFGPNPSYWAYHLGMFSQSLQPKLVYRTVAGFARSLNR